MKKTLKLAFVDFAINWGSWPDPVKFFVDALSDEYDVDVLYSDFRGQERSEWSGAIYPDVAICSYPGIKYKQFLCPTIWFPGEPRELNFTDYDYVMSHHFSEDPRHYRLPLYALYGDVNRLTAPRVYDPTWAQREFCCVLFGKPYPYEQTPREEFFRELCKYKHVHSAGRHLNNTGFVITPQQKAEYIKNFKFVLSFESCALPGFTTEKIFEPLLMNTVPIYWGNSCVGRDFNIDRFIRHYSFCDIAETIERIKVFDSEDILYRKMLEQSGFDYNVVNEYVDRQNIVNFFKKVLNDA